jgi:uncharacterized protein
MLSLEGMDVRFDDREALAALVSDDFGAFGSEIVVTQGMIDDFAFLTRDDQWIHTDTERCARESPFGGKTIAHGFLVLSLVGALSADQDLVIVGQRVIINYGAEYLRFVSPVPVDSRIHARRRLVAVAEKGPGTQLTFESAIHVVDSDKPAVIYRSLVLFMP